MATKTLTTTLPAEQTTQARHPWRTALRTAVQVGIPAVLALGVLVPMVVQIVLEEVGARTEVPGWLTVALLGVSAAVTGVAAVLTRVMAIPGVEDWLRAHKLVRGLAAEPSVSKGPAGGVLSARVTVPDLGEKHPTVAGHHAYDIARQSADRLDP